jgi:hypothetical protein
LLLMADLGMPGANYLRMRPWHTPPRAPNDVNISGDSRAPPEAVGHRHGALTAKVAARS